MAYHNNGYHLKLEPRRRNNRAWPEKKGAANGKEKSYGLGGDHF
jgi:hypothetical protein